MLKQLKLRKQIELRKNNLQDLIKRESEMQSREAELENALNEVQNDEDLEVVNGEIEKLEKEKEEITTDKTKVEKEIEDLEKELKETEEKEETSKKDEEERENQKINNEKQERGKKTMFRTRNQKMTREERLEYLQREDVRGFFTNLRTAIEKRSIEGLNLTIPEITMELIRDNLGEYSVFYNLVKVKPVNGTARAIIAGEAHEAIWTEMIAKVNELAYAFSQVEVDGYKVGGFIPVDNSIIEDSMLDLSVEIEEILAESIGIALDKAIIYGKGTKMPLGFVTALAADTELKSSNILKLSVADTKLDKIIACLKNIKRGKNGRGPITVVMSETTWLGTILPLSLTTNSNGAYATAQAGTFPGTGYKVEFCEQIPEGDMIAGDFSKYILAERKGKKITSSTEVKFIEDVTVFKGTARYDGKPVRKSAFVVIGLNGVAPTTSVDFTPDTANEEETANETVEE